MPLFLPSFRHTVDDFPATIPPRRDGPPREVLRAWRDAPERQSKKVTTSNA